MFLIAAAMTIVHAPPPSRAPVAVQATATVRVLSGIPLKLDSPHNPGAPKPRDCTVTANGTPRRARLIEFE